MRVCPNCYTRYPSEVAHCGIDGSELVAPSDPRQGVILGGRYRLEGVLGRGGMATVYRAHHLHTDQYVAIKVLHSRFSDNNVARERLVREVASTAKLSHPNIIEMFDVGQTSDLVPYVSMELLAGQPLDTYLKNAGGRLNAREVIAFGIQLARGLARAHDFGVVHRDIKPSNVFVCLCDDSTPVLKLVDFGLALVAGASRLTGNELVGSPAYMAPERFKRSQDAGPAGDLYSLGVLLFEAATGTLPFHSESIAGFVLQHLEKPAPTIRSVVRSLPKALDSLVAQLLQKEPKDRPRDAHAVIRVLAKMASEEQLRVRKASMLSITRARAPSMTELWRTRQHFYHEMESQIPGQLAPFPREMLEEFDTQIDQLDALSKEAAKEEEELSKRLDALKATRERLGHAVETLGQDLSKMCRIPSDASARYTNILATLLEMEMKQPGVPSPKGLALLKEATTLYREWLSGTSDEANEADLRYQLEVLRSQLERIEEQAAAERATSRQRLQAIGDQRRQLEDSLLETSEILSTTFRAHPETHGLFAQLRG